MTPKEKVEKLIKYIKFYIEDRDTTVGRFAKKVKVPRATVYSWLKGENMMRLTSYYKVIDAMGIKETDFIAQRDSI